MAFLQHEIHPFALSLSKPALSLSKGGGESFSCFDRLSTNGNVTLALAGSAFSRTCSVGLLQCFDLGTRQTGHF